MRIESFSKKTEIIEFESLVEFYDYLCKTPTNEAFRTRSELSSGTVNEYRTRFTKTKDFKEAVDLFKFGWSEMAAELTQKLKIAESKQQPKMKPRSTLGVCGYQAIVPLYLQGVPNNMVNTKMVPVKQKVITINKSIDYHKDIGSDTIMNESIKALQIIKRIESLGYRCNVNIVLGAEAGAKQFVVKVKIKSSDEKLNVSKMAFPLVHPSMLRRLFFRFIEVYPNVTKSFIHSYGGPASNGELRAIFSYDYLLPAIIRKDVNVIQTLEGLERI